MDALFGPLDEGKEGKAPPEDHNSRNEIDDEYEQPYFYDPRQAKRRKLEESQPRIDEIPQFYAPSPVLPAVTHRIKDASQIGINEINQMIRLQQQQQQPQPASAITMMGSNANMQMPRNHQAALPTADLAVPPSNITVAMPDPKQPPASGAFADRCSPNELASSVGQAPPDHQFAAATASQHPASQAQITAFSRQAALRQNPMLHKSHQLFNMSPGIIRVPDALMNNNPSFQSMSPFFPYHNFHSMLNDGGKAPGGIQSAETTFMAQYVKTPNPEDATKLSGRKPIILYMPCDDDSLSAYQCLVRKQIELFEADRDEVECNAKGRNKPIVLGQVGIRCRHCPMLPPAIRDRGSKYYPAKLNGLYQAAQTMASGHFCNHCKSLPQHLRKELLVLREKKSSAGGGKKYWGDGVRVLGVYEDENGLCFKKP